MKRLDSNLQNMVLSLTLVALVTAALLGGMYVLTEEPIRLSKENKQMQAKVEVLPVQEGVSFAEAEDHDGVMVYRAYVGEEFVGAAVETFDPNGFNGRFSLMIGFDKEGQISGYKVLEQNETPGLGANMVEWFRTDKGKQNIIGLDPAKTNMKVSKDGGDVDAITAATITSRAFLRAVERAYKAYADQPNVDAAGGATALTGATTLNEPVAAEEENVEPENVESNE